LIYRRTLIENESVNHKCRKLIRRLLFLILVLMGIRSAHAQAPVADFGANFTSGCSPLTVTFQDKSSNSPKFWNWDFGNGQLSNLQNPSISFGTPGTYSITLVVRNNDGTNGITKTDYITVYPSPQANFTADKTIGCLPSTVQFTDLSIPNAGTITAWNWDFGDGQTGTGPNPSHQYTAIGFYTVTLRVISSTGCQNVYSVGRMIRIVPGVIADFDFTNPGTCRGPFNVPFSNLTSGPGALTYQWDFGNSTNSTADNPVAGYAASGTYNVSLLATSEFGCSGSIQKPVNITGTTTFFNSPDTVCLNTTVNFQNASSPAPKSSVWDFGNGLQSVKINDASTYPVAGNYNVKLINVYDECKDSITKPLVVMDIPVVDFTAPVTTACKGPLTVNFQEMAPNAASWQWNFGDGNTGAGPTPSHIYTAPGSYDVTLTITTRQGCTNTITKTAFVRIVTPTVSFSNAPAGGCIPYAFSPTATANAIDGVASYLWEYGDAGFTATTGTPTGPNHNYTVAGGYTIKVTITTNGGCTVSSELVNGVITGTPPTANFSFAQTTTCASDSVDFTDLSTPSPGVNEWLWDFGDGTTSILQNPRHGFKQTGTLAVKLIAYANRCPSPPATQTITINPPIAEFDYTVSCTPKFLVSFTDKSITDPAFGAISYAWDFGDGNTATTVGNTSHNYAGPGTYPVKLTVTNGTCSFTYSTELKLAGDVADFTISDAAVCKFEAFTLTAINSSAANGSTYEWSLDGVNFFTGTQVQLGSYASIGTRDIALRLTDINGCVDNKKVPNGVTVTGPTANFKPATKGGCNNAVITFNDLSTGSAGVASWIFDFGDGTTKTFTAAPFTHTYTTPGEYVVKLTATDANNCSDTYTSLDTVMITQPVVGFKSDFTTICPKTDIKFTDTTTGLGLHYAWDFGDGNTSTLASPVHQYNATSGSFTVKLEITDTVGCTSTVTKTDYISVKTPKPAFDTKDTSTICTLLETKFTFKGTDYQSFYWDFGDGTTSTLLNPNHFYNDYGTYEAKLYLIGFGGCLDSASDTIHVYNPYLTTSINYSPTSSCNSLLVDFLLANPPSTKFTFTFGDGNIDNSQSLAFQHFYGQPAYYAPSILLQDSLGCQVSIGGPVTISVIGALPLFGVDKKSFCDSGTVFFTDYTIGNDPVVSHTWDFKDGTTSTAVNPTHKFTTPGTYLVTQTATTVNGCTNSFNDTIRIYATPDPRIVSDTVVCINNVLALQGALALPDSTVTWKWDLGSNGQATTQNTSVKYGQAGSYTVSLEASNKLGCKDNISKNIRVPVTPSATVAGSPAIVSGSGANIPITYSPEVVKYTWTPPSGLSCTDCAVPYANPQFTTKYNVQVEDIYGCTANQEVMITVVCNAENYFVPNTFSPNGDGQNDVFMPRGKSINRVNRMQVFNRWGELVYEKRDFMVNDASAGWNGTYKGKPANPDVYIYLIEFVCNNASIVPYRGNVTLIR
jgi:gliding motility-associated-like protein